MIDLNQPALRIIYFGTRAPCSVEPLTALLGAGMEVVAVVVPSSSLPGVPAPPIAPLAPPCGFNIPLLGTAPEPATLAHTRGIPVFAVARPGHPDTLAALAALRPDAISVACFPRRLPPALLGLPRLGCLNLHPALLPAYRGPAPLFWALHNGERHSGVTVHLMDAQFDTGPILLQEPFELPEGCDEAALDALWSGIGARLMLAALQGLAAGTLAPRPQPPGGSYQPWPTPDDFALDTTWTARHAFHFMRGTNAWGRRYPLEVAGQRLRLTSALAYDPTTQLDMPLMRDGDTLLVRFRVGTLRARIAQ